MHRYRLTHVTEFRYDDTVTESYNEVRLRPLQDDLQTCISFRLHTRPASRPTSHVDHFGNWVQRFNVLTEHKHLRIEAESVVLVQRPPGLHKGGLKLSKIERYADELDDHYDLIASTVFVPHTSAVRDLSRQAERDSDGTLSGFARSATALVHNTFRYEKGATHVHSSINDALSSGAGVCQDFAHILLAMLRVRGIPARYVSGYLASRTQEPVGSVEEVIGGQASHAWVEMFVPAFGWAPLDPTFGKAVGTQHVRVAYGRDYGDVAPVRGVYNGRAGQRLSVDVRVRPALDDEGHEQLLEPSSAPSERQSEHQQQ